MSRRRYVFALGLSLIAFAPMTARPSQDARGREVVKGRSYPDTWPEIEALNKWNPIPLSVSLPEGTYLLRSWRDTFGWFCYRTFVDPGPIWSVTNKGGLVYRRPPCEELHGYFRVLTAACTGDAAFGGGLKLLFENVDVFARSVHLWWIDPDKLGPLSQEQRAPLLKVAKAMRQVAASATARRETRAAADVIAALTESNEFPEDTVSTQELAHIPDLHLKQPLVGFLSQYYLACALAFRNRQSDAARILEYALKKYSNYLPLRDLQVYHHALQWNAQFEPERQSVRQTRRFTIWSRPSHAAQRVRDRRQLGLLSGEVIARRFQAPANGKSIRGTLYILGAGEDVTNILVSVCADREGHPGDISKTQLCRTGVTVRVPQDDGRKGEVYPFRFGERCELKQGRSYWLVIEAEWPHASEVEPRTQDFRNYPLRFLLFLSIESPTLESILRAYGSGVGATATDYFLGDNLAAQLEVVADPVAKP
jgi:hypothetical protein